MLNSSWWTCNPSASSSEATQSNGCFLHAAFQDIHWSELPLLCPPSLLLFHSGVCFLDRHPKTVSIVPGNRILTQSSCVSVTDHSHHLLPDLRWVLCHSWFVNERVEAMGPPTDRARIFWGLYILHTLLYGLPLIPSALGLDPAGSSLVTHTESSG